MRTLIVTCDRCGSIIKEDHPDRITIARQRFETYTTYSGEQRTKNVYKNDKPIHLCAECNVAFKKFLTQELDEDEVDFDEAYK